MPETKQTPDLSDWTKQREALGNALYSYIQRLMPAGFGAITRDGLAAEVERLVAPALDALEAERDELRALSGEGWLPNVLCPTDGVWRMHKLPDGSEVVAMFDGYSLGNHTRRWRTKEFAYHNPSRPTGESFGGVERFSEAYDTFVIQDLPEGVYPTHFRPNDTVHRAASALPSQPPQGEG